MKQFELWGLVRRKKKKPARMLACLPIGGLFAVTSPGQRLATAGLVIFRQNGFKCVAFDR